MSPNALIIFVTCGAMLVSLLVLASFSLLESAKNTEHSTYNNTFDESNSFVKSSIMNARLYFLKRPILTNLLNSAFLATVWIIAWLIVLIFVTMALGTTFSGITLLSALILSTVAEAAIRYSESTSKQNPDKVVDKTNEKIRRSYSATDVSLALLAFTLIASAYFIIPKLVTNVASFESEYTAFESAMDIRSTGTFFSQIISIFSNKMFFLILLLCWVLRIAIYKKPHISLELTSEETLKSEISTEEFEEYKSMKKRLEELELRQQALLSEAKIEILKAEAYSVEMQRELIAKLFEENELIERKLIKDKQKSDKG